MTSPERERLEGRILILAFASADAAVAQSVLTEGKLEGIFCANLEFLERELPRGAAALIISEEAVAADPHGRLARATVQPADWSDLPILLVTQPGADSAAVTAALASLGNVILLERPLRPLMLLSAVRAALRARVHQYQLRDRVETQALLAAIVESSQDAIVSKTLDGIILTWNAGAERLFGYTAAEVVGRSITLIIPPAMIAEEALILEKLRRGERIEHYETVRVSKTGRLIDISLTISPIRDSTNRIVAASKVARDITEAKQVQEALRDADRRKDEFLATLAHELRNPLAPIRNSLHILRLAGTQTPVTERVCEMLERQVNHMVRLVDDLMEISRISRGKIELRIEPVELAAIVHTAVETSRPLIDAARHQLHLSLPPEPLILEADAVRLAQVFSNLLNNAAKYTDAGGQIWLTASRQGGQAAVSVRDNGVGIPADMLPRVFDMFTQIAPARHHLEGLGIGLTLVRSLVQMHGGSVEANSAGPNQGSEFVVRLPLKAPGCVAPAPRRTYPPPAVATPRRVLVVDDNHDAGESLGMLLKFLGCDVHVVRDGEAALAALPDYRPTVVLLDIGLPAMDGYNVVRRIRQQPEFSGVICIALTGWGQEEDRRRSQIAGFNYHLVKPVDIALLRELLNSLHAGVKV